MTQEKPLVGWKEISAYLGVCKKTAKDKLKDFPFFLPDYAPRKAVYSFDLQKYLRRHINST